MVTCVEELDRSRPRAIISAATQEDQRWLFPSERRDTEREAKGEGERPAVRGHGMSLVTDLFRGGGEGDVAKFSGGRGDVRGRVIRAQTHTQEKEDVYVPCAASSSRIF